MRIGDHAWRLRDLHSAMQEKFRARPALDWLRYSGLMNPS